MSRKGYTRSFLFVIIIIMLSAFYTLPFYVTKPGMAQELEPIVEVENGDEAEGSFMLTTVRMGKANIYGYVLAKMSKYQELYPEEAIRDADESEKEYSERQLHMMDGSKNSAIKIAYEKAGKPFSFNYLGVYVLGVIKGMPAYGKLKPGDQIIKVDNLKFQSSAEFIEYVGKKKADDTVLVTYKREDVEKTVKISLQTFKEQPEKVGMGISLDDYKKPVTDPPITIKTDQIGGPSAGLMFSLEIYNQLTEGDITSGYQIAGTGTLSEDGTIGPIGGIQQKIVAADKTGAEIFFAPNEKGVKGSNYQEALIAAKDINTNMKIVPVDRFDDALDYLHSLEK